MICSFGLDLVVTLCLSHVLYFVLQLHGYLPRNVGYFCEFQFLLFDELVDWTDAVGLYGF